MNQTKLFLDHLYETYHDPSFLESDPLEFPHRYRDPLDQEAVALISALLAYGNVRQIRASIEKLLLILGSSPGQTIRALGQEKNRKKMRINLGEFVHRFNTGNDILAIFCLIQSSWNRYGSVGNHFLKGHEKSDLLVFDGTHSLTSEWKTSVKKLGINRGPYFEHLLSSPKQGSCCKRWMMFLRWVGRKDRLDLGLWNEGSPILDRKTRSLKPSDLIIPLDTHTSRLSQYLGFCSRKSPNWRSAVEVTEKLKDFCSDDPVKYDFSLSRLGILDLCQKRFHAEICKRCQLLPVCLYAQNQLGVNHESRH